MDNLKTIRALIERCNRTCSLLNPVEGALTYAKDLSVFSLLENLKDQIVLIPKDTSELAPAHIQVIEVENPRLIFVLCHNKINRGNLPAENRVSRDAVVHKSAIIGAEGLSLCRDPAYRDPPADIVRFKHMGSVVIKAGAYIGPYSVVHRATLDQTVISEQATVGALCNIGHNVYVGPQSILTACISVGGSSHIGESCYVGMGAMIMDHIKICDHVRIGMGAIVTKDIKVPGIYHGNPATYKGPWDGGWHR